MLVSLTNRVNSDACSLANPKNNGHFVQFYEADDRLLARNVSEYLGEGLQRGEVALVVASADHGATFTRELSYSGVNTDAAMAQGRFTLLDAQEALDSFMVHRRPDRARFQSTIGTLVRQIRQRTECSGLRAYGEMVGLLWAAGQYSAAIELEEFWNELLQSVGFSLFCGYPIDVFSREFQADSVYALLCDHTHVVPTGANGDIEHAVNQAMDEILGPEEQNLRVGLKANHPSAWAKIPSAEAKILWLRDHVPDSADDVLTRARQLYQASRCLSH